MVSGSKLRFEYLGEQIAEGKTIQQDLVMTFDGVENRSLFRPCENSLQPYPNGFIGGRSGPLLDTLPLRWMFATSQPALAEVSMDSLTIAKEGFIDGVRCVIAESSANPGIPLRAGMSAPPGSIYSYWLDPGAGYSIRRFTWGYGGKTNVQIDATYILDKSGVWVPNSWKSWRFDQADRPTETTDIRMTSCEVNPKLSDKEFSIEFPPNTIVTDQRGGKSYLYIVKAGGGKRVITPAEVNANVSYDRLLATESGRAHLQSNPYPIFRLVLGASALALLFAGIAYWRFRQSRIAS